VSASPKKEKLEYFNSGHPPSNSQNKILPTQKETRTMKEGLKSKSKIRKRNLNKFANRILCKCIWTLKAI